MKHLCPLALVAIVGCGTITPTKTDPPTHAAGDPCVARSADYDLGVATDDGSGTCVAERDVQDLPECQVVQTTIAGTGTSPGASGLSAYRTGSSQDGSAELRTPQSSGTGWSWKGTSLSCSTTGCANGHYRVTAAANGGDCADLGRITLTLRVD